MSETEKIGLGFLLGNKVFKYCFPLYKPLYALYKRISDRYERDFLRNIVKSGMIVADIGANIGIYSAFFAKIVGKSGKVYAFEPSPHNFHLLRKYNKDKNITAVQAAVGDTTGKITLYVSDKLNVDHRTYETGESREKIEIDSYRLDDYLKDEKVDFIKMDIQGFEYQAFLGMKNILQNNPDIKILTEFWPYGLIKAGSSAEELLDFLHNLGFKTEIIEGASRKQCPPIPERKDFPYYVNLLVFR